MLSKGENLKALLQSSKSYDHLKNGAGRNLSAVEGNEGPASGTV